MECGLPGADQINTGGGAMASPILPLFCRSPALAQFAAEKGNCALRHGAVFGYIRALSGRGEAPFVRPSSTLLAPGGSVFSASP
jgi:hypothetical protein